MSDDTYRRLDWCYSEVVEDDEDDDDDDEDKVYPHSFSPLDFSFENGNWSIIKQIEIMDADTSQIKLFCQVF